MKKKIVSIIASLAMLSALIPCVYAASIADSGNICDDNYEITITWTLYSDGVLKLNGTGEIDTRIASKVNADAVKSVVIEEGITGIGSSSFKDFTSMTSITLPESLKTISGYGFKNCTSLKTIHIPAGVEEVSESFPNCTALRSITVDKDNMNYKDINGILFSKDEKTILQYPANRTASSYTIPDGTETIDSDCFHSVKGLTTISIPASVTQIYSSFINCMMLKAISVSPNNEYYTSMDGILFDKNQSVLHYYPCAKSGGLYEIPETVNKIHSYAFSYNKYLTKVNIPSSVTTIEDCAFTDCASLEEIYIPSSVTTMEYWVFMNCSALKKAVIDAHINLLAESSFEHCNVLEEVTLPEGLETIEYNAFYHCINMASITVPEGVTKIYERAFAYCDLIQVYLPSTIKLIDAGVFENSYVGSVYYNGLEEDWETVYVGDYGNNHFLKATYYYIAKPYFADDLQYNPDTGEITVSLSRTYLDCTLVAAAYKDNICVDITSKALEKNSETDTITIPAVSADKITVYIWDSFKGLEPMCEPKEVNLTEKVIPSE